MRYSKYLVYFLGIALLLFSCKKDNPDNNKKENEPEKPPKVATALIKASTGGTLETSDSIKMIIPAGALPGDATVSVGITGNEPKSIPNPNYSVIGKPFTIKLPVDSLKTSVKIIFPKPLFYSDYSESSLLAFNGSTYFPLIFIENGSLLETDLQIIDWENNLKNTTYSRGVLDLGITLILIKRQTPNPNEIGLKELSATNLGVTISDINQVNAKSKILLLIHGWMGRAKSTWEEFLPKFQLRSYSGYTKYWSFGYNSSYSISQNAQELSNLIAAQSNGATIDIVAHSMGGLVARSAIESYRLHNNIKHLVTLGTPHLGSPLAAIQEVIGQLAKTDNSFDFYNISTQGFRDLNPSSIFIQQLITHDKSEVSYYTIACIDENGISDNFFREPNDGVVSVASAKTAFGADSPPVTLAVKSIAHLNMTDDLGIISQVAHYLNTNSPAKTYPPTIRAVSVSAISSTGVKSGGNITSDGGNPVIARGVCWNTSPNPTIANGKTIDGTGTGLFESSINGLTPNTKYYVRAYATNANGTVYGEEENFTTLKQPVPSVFTTTISNIDATSAVSGGTILAEGGVPAVTARGVCWSTSPNPTIANSKTSDGSGSGTFTSNISGLTPDTKYYVRAYATNANGTAYGSEVSFTTTVIGGSLPSPILLSPENNIEISYPRNTFLQWKEVKNAISYYVDIQIYTIEEDIQPSWTYYNLNESYLKWFGVKYYNESTNNTSLYFKGVGSQKHRWRVKSIGVNGQESSYSDWRYINYTS